MTPWTESYIPQMSPDQIDTYRARSETKARLLFYLVRRRHSCLRCGTWNLRQGQTHCLTCKRTLRSQIALFVANATYARISNGRKGAL
jgi:hypothetical protein